MSYMKSYPKVQAEKPSGDDDEGEGLQHVGTAMQGSALRVDTLNAVTSPVERPSVHHQCWRSRSPDLSCKL